MAEKIKDNIIRSFVVIRADNDTNTRRAVKDIVNYAGLHFVDGVREMNPAYADRILVQIMKTPLRAACEHAAVIATNDDGHYAVRRVKDKEFRPPAHLIIVDNWKHNEVFNELMVKPDKFPSFE